MKMTPLKDYLDQPCSLNQVQLAGATGFYQGTLCMMAKPRRQVFVRTDCWPFEIWEKRVPGKSKPSKKRVTKKQDTSSVTQ